jgi:TolA-binding protein
VERLRQTPSKAALALALGGSFLAACWTSASEGEALRRRVRELEQGQSEQREELQAEIQNAQTKVAELEEVLERATKVVTRASADTGAQVEQLQQQLMALEGQLAELRNEVQRQQEQLAEQQGQLEQRLDKIARRVGIDSAVDESEIPADADAHFAAAEQAFEAEQYSRARAFYRAFIERHRQDERVDDAQYKIGASYLEEGRPATALGELRSVVSEHPRGNVADDALLGMARAFYALHACTDARSALEAFSRAHRRSDLMPEARRLLREVQRAPDSYCTR